MRKAECGVRRSRWPSSILRHYSSSCGFPAGALLLLVSQGHCGHRALAKGGDKGEPGTGTSWAVLPQNSFVGNFVENFVEFQPFSHFRQRWPIKFPTKELLGQVLAG